MDRLLDDDGFPGYRPRAEIRGGFGDPRARVIRLERVQKKRLLVVVVRFTGATTTRRYVGDGTCHVGMRRIASKKFLEGLDGRETILYDRKV